MSQLHTDQKQNQSSFISEGVHNGAKPKRAPLIDRLVDPSNVVFSLVFCQKARREFDVQQAG